jgi:hypothetical protein
MSLLNHLSKPGDIMDVAYFSATGGLPASFKTLSGFSMATHDCAWDGGSANKHVSPAIASQRLGRTHGVYGLPKKKAKKKREKAAKKEAEKRAVEDARPAAAAAAEGEAAAAEGGDPAPVDPAAAPASPLRSTNDSLTVALRPESYSDTYAESDAIRLQLQTDLGKCHGQSAVACVVHPQYPPALA